MQELVEFSTANPWLVSGLVASALAVIFYELKLKARDIGSLSIPLAVRMINEGSRVVDVRANDQFATGHIVDAQNIPLEELRSNPDRLQKLKKGALLICDTGVKSAELTAELRKNGLENVFSIKGGLMAWQQDNLPVVKD
jgi:rhodanese-related sulfurtransferase